MRWAWPWLLVGVVLLCHLAPLAWSEEEDHHDLINDHKDAEGVDNLKYDGARVWDAVAVHPGGENTRENEKKDHNSPGGDHDHQEGEHNEGEDHHGEGDDENSRKRWDDYDAHRPWNEEEEQQPGEDNHHYEEPPKRWDDVDAHEPWNDEDHHGGENEDHHDEPSDSHPNGDNNNNPKDDGDHPSGEEGQSEGDDANSDSLRPDEPVPDNPPTLTLVSSTGGLVASADPIVMEDGAVILAFKGIPYATPPLEALRWRPPRPLEPWNGVMSGAEYGSDCVQVEGWGSEDCLYVNVWTPADAVRTPDDGEDKPKLPVLVYLHGGGLMSGSGSDPMDRLVWKAGPEGCGIVAVSLNYRLNIFGFLATDELSIEQNGISGNYGIMDQQMALRWVQDNIEAFGGDRKRVTIMGQSSGGTSVYALLSSPASNGLFSRAIALSGSPNMTMDGLTAQRNNADIPTMAGCGELRTWQERMGCLRAAPVEDLLNAIPMEWTMPTMWDLPDDVTGKPYPGLAIVDGRVVAYPFFEALEKGIVDVPFLFGNMAEEGDISFPSHHYPELGSKKEKDWKKFIVKKFKPWGPKAGETIYNAYRQDFLRGGPRKGYDAIIADISMTCGHLQAAKAAVSGGNFRSPLYMYNNGWAPAKPVQISGVMSKFAFHTWDYVNGFDVYKDFTPSPVDLAHGKFLRQAWYEVIANGSISPSLGWLPVQAVTTSRSLKGKPKGPAPPPQASGPQCHRGVCDE